MIHLFIIYFFLDSKNLIIPPYSFITMFSNSFLTKRNTIIPQVVVKTALFDTSLNIPFIFIAHTFKYFPHYSRFYFVTGEPLTRFTLYIVIIEFHI